MAWHGMLAMQVQVQAQVVARPLGESDVTLVLQREEE